MASVVPRISPVLDVCLQSIMQQCRLMSIPPVSTSPPFNITRASHVRYLVKDLDESLRFYTEFLDLSSAIAMLASLIFEALRSPATTAWF